MPDTFSLCVVPCVFILIKTCETYIAGDYKRMSSEESKMPHLKLFADFSKFQSKASKKREGKSLQCRSREYLLWRNKVLCCYLQLRSIIRKITQRIRSMLHKKLRVCKTLFWRFSSAWARSNVFSIEAASVKRSGANIVQRKTMSVVTFDIFEAKIFFLHLYNQPQWCHY